MRLKRIIPAKQPCLHGYLAVAEGLWIRGVYDVVSTMAGTAVIRIVMKW
ncbi:hypothetical protein [Sporofaciens sp. JLR.KK001]